MGQTDYPGIDYSGGHSNYDTENGIHFGVISPHEVLQVWADSSEPEYGDPHCPNCGDQCSKFKDGLDAKEADKLVCLSCEALLDDDDIQYEEPIGYILDDGEYKASCGEDRDIFILKSPYYTKAQFCSPCAPGAGYLLSPCEDGPRTYCFDHEWFEDDVAPYPVYKVSDDSIVLSPKHQTASDTLKGE